ncbi:inactive tyrosine-protein kinase PRAG1 isoform X3 [Panthera onca]|uniref:inactive tyrosine-protein kinase PRAG1 isoform X3 n=1 Tax=Panthera onca TaxID=9690 RepID=UPI002955D9C8|nr:inactive tyrosine-protein kinase PRAG1 isoform X3 [Panthera onca]
MHQTVRLSPASPKMSACSDFVEHIWKPGSCKNCFCLRSDHQLAPGHPQPRAGSLPPPPRLPPRAETCRQEDDAVNSSPYSKPTIAVKPTMMSSDASDVWTEANLSAEVSQELTSTQESFRQKVAAFAGMTSGCHEGAGPCPSPQPPRESLASEDDSDQRCSPSGDSEGGEYCSILDCCPGSPTATATSQAASSRCRPGGGDRPAVCWGQAVCTGSTEEQKRVVSFPRECCSQGPAENPPRLGPKKLSLPSEAAGSSDGLSCGSPSSGASSPFAPHLESDYCSLMKEPVPGKQQDAGSNRCLGLTGEPQPPAHPREAVQPEPIYAESTKRKKAVPAPSKPQATAEHAAAAARGQGQVRTANAWAPKAPSGWGRDREGPDKVPQVAATITVMAAHPEEDRRTIYLSSPDSAVGVQWPRGPLSQDSEAGEEETSAGQGLSSRESHRSDASENTPKGKPAIPPKLSKSSPGGSPVSPSASPLSDLSEGSAGGGLGPQALSGGPTDSASSCRANGVATNDSVWCHPPAATASALDQRRPRYQTGAWSRQCRIEEEEEVEQELLSQSWGREMENGATDPSNSSAWHRLRPTDGSSGQSSKVGTGMSKSASFAFEFPKDRSGIEVFSPPPPPPKSRHLLKMNKSSSDLEKVSQGSAESLSPPCRGVHVGFTTGSTDSLASDSRTCSDGGPSSEPAHSPTSSGKKLFAPVPFPSGSTEDVSPSGPLQPPPLPQKKLVSRAASSPDGFFWTQGSPKPRTASPKLNLSHSETNVCAHEESHFSYSSSPGSRHHHIFSSSEPLEKTFKGNGHWVPAPGLAGGQSGFGSPSLQCKGVPSASQLSVSSQASTGSTQLQLHSLLGSISSKEGTYAKLGGLYAQSLVRLAAKCEDLFMGGQKKELHFNENNWSLFKLTCNRPCCDSGDAIYYCATCSEDPGSTYAVKICKTPEPKAAPYCSPSVPVHFNIQQDCGHFVASVPSSMLTSPDAPKDPLPAPPSHPPAQEQDCVVVITPEVPHQTASDFVRDSASSHQSEPEVYERRVCFLLLQLCNGLEHLKEHGIIHRDLCLENLLLVHCSPQASPGASPAAPSPSPAGAPAACPSASLAAAAPAPAPSPACQGVPSEKYLPRLIISNFLKAKQKPGGTTNLQQKKSQARLAPEIVSASQYRKFDEFQTGILIYELLHQPNPFEVRARLREQDYRQEDLPPLPALSLYSPGLQQLAHLLLEADPIKRIRIGEAKRVLQCLLWGPRRELVEQPGTSEEVLCGTLHNWIDMKRALMMMKFAERAADRRRGVELEDWLCCQYLAAAEPGALLQSLKLLQLL